MKPAPCSLAGTTSGIGFALAVVGLVVAKNGVVGGQNGAAAVAEDGLDALVSEDLDNNVRAGHRLPGERVLALKRRLSLGFHGVARNGLRSPLCNGPIQFLKCILLRSVDEKFLHCNSRCSEPTFAS